MKAEVAHIRNPGATPRRALVLCKYDTRAASTRQRLVQLMPYLKDEQITLEFAPLFDNDYLTDVLVRGKRSIWKTLVAYVKRLCAVLRVARYDFVWVQYEIFPYLPGWCERLVLRGNTPLVLDYDDAIFHQYDQHTNPLLRLLLANKLKPLLRRASLTLCGNRYLQQYALQECKNSQIFPTVVNCEHYQSVEQRQNTEIPVIGWIGSPSTWRYCAHVQPMLVQLVEQKRATVLVVGAGPAADHALPFTFRDWTEDSEITDIQAMDIGIMPIPDEPWARGKCGYKLIQYMACGLPVIASPVGVNNDIVVKGINGFLPTTEPEWLASFEALLRDPLLRDTMGAAGRKIIESRYSIQHYGPTVAHWLATLFTPSERGAA